MSCDEENGSAVISWILSNSDSYCLFPVYGVRYKYDTEKVMVVIAYNIFKAFHSLLLQTTFGIMVLSSLNAS